jgi:hypothetical protein
MPSYGITVPGDRLATLRSHAIPVIGRVRESATILDLRSVDPADDAILADALRGLG